jgi:hypothetical protein
MFGVQIIKKYEDYRGCGLCTAQNTTLHDLICHDIYEYILVPCQVLKGMKQRTNVTNFSWQVRKLYHVFWKQTFPSSHSI